MKIKKLISTILVLALVVCAMPAMDLHAASASTKYIKELKVFYKTGGSESDAKDWCKEKNKDGKSNWKVIPGNLNEGASGALKREVGVFLCYQTTTDPDEAIRDMAVMNEKGNYSGSAYKMILEEQQKVYKDMVVDMKEMLNEYRTNVKNKVETALQAQSFLNAYVDDDSGKLLGNLLVDISDEDLVKLLMQANGQIVLAIQEYVAYGCDTKQTTWLDRMEKIKSYENMRKSYIKAYNCSASTADANLKKSCHTSATIIANNWNDVKDHIEHAQKFTKNRGIDKMSNKEYKKWIKDNVTEDQKDTEIITYYQEMQVINLLGGYKYDDKTLFDFFSQDYKEISGDNIYKLYPLASSLSKGQKSAIDESISLFKLILDAASANAFNDNNNASTEMIDENTSDDNKKDLEEAKEAMEAASDAIKKTDPISVYEGVDREIYDGNVAVTSTAENYSSGNTKKWADGFVESGGFAATSISLGALSIVSLGAAIVCARIATAARNSIIKTAFRDAAQQGFGNVTIYTDTIVYTEAAKKFAMERSFGELMKPKTAIDINPQMRQWVIDKAPAVRSDLLAKGSKLESTQGAVSKASLFNKLKIGFTIFAIVLCVVDIVVSCITLVKYYNRKHDSIPKFMVDMSYNEDKETSYINYKSVQDNNGECGDLNGEGGKQWLAIYATKDLSAGDPILAPEDGNDFKVQYKSTSTPSGYSPLHMFGTPNSAQNLTFADGESGYSYNDKKGGTYLFFKRDKSGDDDMFSAGTSMSKPSVWVGMASSLLIGLGLGICATTVLLKRRKKKA